MIRLVFLQILKIIFSLINAIRCKKVIINFMIYNLILILKVNSIFNNIGIIFEYKSILCYYVGQFQILLYHCF